MGISFNELGKRRFWRLRLRNTKCSSNSKNVAEKKPAEGAARTGFFVARAARQSGEAFAVCYTAFFYLL